MRMRPDDESRAHAIGPVVAGVHGNRTHPDPTWSGHSRFEDDGSHQAPSTPNDHPSTDLLVPARPRPRRSRRPPGRRKDTPRARAGGTATQQTAGRLRIERERAIRGDRRPSSRRCAERYASLRSAPPVRVPARQSARAPGSSGSASPSILSVTPLARAMCEAWPSRPKPVTSVAQRDAEASAARLAARVQRAHRRVQRVACAFEDSSPCFAAVASSPVPSGLVRTSRSPASRGRVREQAIAGAPGR